MWKVPISIKRKTAFPVLVTKIIAKASLEWEEHDYPLTLANKDLYIPHGDWLKDYVGFGDVRKKKKRPSSSSLQAPMTQELGLKLLQRLEHLERVGHPEELLEAKDVEPAAEVQAETDTQAADAEMPTADIE
ncbi:hypothetical protein HN51_069626, partial [Arachis hypogaea]